jgi:hypothetical protein
MGAFYIPFANFASNKNAKKTPIADDYADLLLFD